MLPSSIKKKLNHNQSSTNWNDVIASRFEDTLRKTTWKTDRTTVCLGIENHNQCNELFPHCPNLFHIDRESTTDDMRPIADIHKIFQFFPKPPTPNQPSNQEQFIISFLPCAYPSCRIDPTHVDNCKHKEECNIQVRDVKKVSSNENNDENELGLLSKNELKEACRTCNLPVGRNKPDLMKCVEEHFEILSAVLDEEADLGVNDEDVEDQ